MKHHLCVTIGSSCRASFFSRIKISLILICLFAAILTAGCAGVDQVVDQVTYKVVYRVNPDSPPKMGEWEARNAVNKALSLIQKSIWMDRIILEGDEFHIYYAEPKRGTGQVLGTQSRYVSYDEIFPYIIKQEEYFAVSFGNVSSSLYWKSGDDARLFLDAVYALRQWRIARNKDPRNAVELALSRRIGWSEIERVYLEGDDLVAVISGRYSSGRIIVGYDLIGQEIKKVEDFYTVPVRPGASYFGISPGSLIINHVFNWKSEEDARLFLDAVSSLRQRKIAREKGITAVASVPAYSQAARETPKPAVSEKTPPKITITAPDISRTMSLEVKRANITITGLVESNAGVIDVLVNGKQAELGEQGHFFSVVPLKVGQNNITVTAIDVFKNKATRQFTVNRKAGKTAVQKKAHADSDYPKTGKQKTQSSPSERKDETTTLYGPK